jgi:hypothetical protein
MVCTDNAPKQDQTEEQQAKGKKAYKKPSLVEWGNIRDLTGGGAEGLEDWPIESGTGLHPG